MGLAAVRARIRRAAGAYATLVRVPNLFTAPPDVLLGAALVAGAGRPAAPAVVAGLAVASALLYAAGTTLNDAFDAPEDAAERPERPIPSGAVSRRAAFAFGFGLLVVGVVAAWIAAGGVAGAVAALLAAVVLLYDGALKGSAVGFLAMGATRGLNVLLGTTVAGAPTDLPPVSLAVPVVVAGYVAAVTYMAAGETAGGNRRAVAVAGAGALTAGVGAVVYAVVAGRGALGAAMAVALAGVFLVWTGRTLRAAHADPVPETIGPAVGACVLALPVLDAAFAASVGPLWAVAAVSFLVPAVVLSRAFEVT